MGPAFVETLPVGKFHGIGPATTAKMNSLGIFTGIDLRNHSLDFLQATFGKAGAYYHSVSREIDERQVRANRVRKLVGAENTFSQDLTTYIEIILRRIEAADRSVKSALFNIRKGLIKRP